MKRKRDILTHFVLSVMIFLFNFSLFIYGMEEEPVKVKFYRLNRETYQKGEYIGELVIEKGNFKIMVKDKELERVLREELSRSYNSFQGEIQNGLAIEKIVTFEPGSSGHLNILKEKCWQKYRIIAEIEKEVKR